MNAAVVPVTSTTARVSSSRVGIVLVRRWSTSSSVAVLRAGVGDGLYDGRVAGWVELRGDDQLHAGSVGHRGGDGGEGRSGFGGGVEVDGKQERAVESVSEPGREQVVGLAFGRLDRSVAGVGPAELEAEHRCGEHGEHGDAGGEERPGPASDEAGPAG